MDKRLKVDKSCSNCILLFTQFHTSSEWRFRVNEKVRFEKYLMDLYSDD